MTILPGAPCSRCLGWLVPPSAVGVLAGSLLVLGGVGSLCHPEPVQVTAALVERVRPGNLRVPRAEFAAVWAAAERRSSEQAARGVTDWYAGGVAVTCRWLAGAVVADQMGRREPARAPVSRRLSSAYEELIEAEFLAAERLDLRRPDLVEHQPGWCEAIRATLRWAWRHEGPPPVVVPEPTVR